MNLDELFEQYSHISPEILHLLDNRIHEWANWNLQKDNPRLGYHSETIEYKMMKFGIFLCEAFGLKPLPTNDQAEEMEKIIRLMATQSIQGMQYATALREYHIGKGRGNQRDTARILGISPEGLRKQLKNAMVWLAGWFTGYYAFKVIHHDKKIPRI